MVTDGFHRFFCGVGKCLTRAFAIRCWIMFTGKPSDNDDVDTQWVADGVGYLIQQVLLNNGWMNGMVFYTARELSLMLNLTVLQFTKT